MARTTENSTILVVLWGPCRRPWKPEIQEIQGAGNGLRKRSGYCKIVNFGAFCGVDGLGSRKSKNTMGLGNGIRKRSGHCKIYMVLLWGSSTFPPFVLPGNQKSRKSKGPWKGAGIAKSTILVLLWCSPSFRRPWKPESQEIQGALEMASGKGGGACKIVNVGAFVGFPPFRRPWKQEIQETQRALEMASGKRAGMAKSAILLLLLLPAFRRPWKPEIQEIQGALEMASGKGAGIAKSTILVFWWCSTISAALEAGNPRNTRRGLGNGIREKSGYGKIGNFAAFAASCISAALEAGNPRTTRSLGNGFRKRSGYCKVDNFGAFVVFPFSSAAWKPEIQEIQGAVEMASGKGAGIAKSTILVLLWGSPHFGGLETEIQGIQGSLEMASGKRADFAKSTTFGLLCGWSWLVEKSGLCARSASQINKKDHAGWIEMSFGPQP